jgi:DNA-binding CsgD family transcriptional regulator
MLSMRCRRGSEGRSDRKMRRRPLKRFFAFQRFPGGYGRLCGGRIRMRSLATSGASGGVHCKPRRRIRPGIARLLCLVGAEPHGFHSRPRIPASVRHEPRARGDRTIFARRRRRAWCRRCLRQHRDRHQFRRRRRGTSAVQRHVALNRIAPVLHALFLATEQVARSPIDLARLTDRQRQLVDLALMGLPDKTIAARLGISEKTVGNHFRGMYKRLGISKRS